MGTEIERKYLLQGDGWKTPEVLATAKKISQTYLATNEGSRAQLSPRQVSGGGFIAIYRENGPSPLPSILIELDEPSFTRLVQEGDHDGVLPIKEGFEARIRVSDGEATLTLKGGKGLKRSEFEAFLDLEEASMILNDPTNFVGVSIQKTRYRANLSDGLVAEIDIFEGANAGLRVVEVELPDVATKVRATSWIGRDVTNGDLGNAKLALNPFSERGANTLSSL